MKNTEKLKKEISEKVKQYCRAAFGHEDFTGGKNRINYGGRYFDEKEVVNLVDSALEFWLTEGRYTSEFEKKLADFIGVKKSLFVNSGSSANLLAFMALASDILGNRKISRGDEVITVAAGFPTTVTPIIQYGAVPVFVDISLNNYNIDTDMLEVALSEKTKAVMVAHTLGNPFNVYAVKKFCKKNKLWLIEDNCDALGSKYDGRFTGSFGDISTCSFYPPHHITTGEGGAVFTDENLLYKIMISLRDWGRDCMCRPGQDNLCGKRFSGKYGMLPHGYDHKYVYSAFGYNLKATDMQAAIGCAQIEKLPLFIKKRRQNFNYLKEGLKKYSKWLILPSNTENSEPSWFGFLITVKKNSTFIRNDLVEHLEKKNIQTRMLFAGNLIKHPCFDIMRKNNTGYRIAGSLENTDVVMQNSFWVGVYPGITRQKNDYILAAFEDFFEGVV